MHIGESGGYYLTIEMKELTHTIYSGLEIAIDLFHSCEYEIAEGMTTQCPVSFESMFKKWSHESFIS
jgi:hypothetical protein